MTTNEQGAQVSDTPMFDEDALERAIHACWGAHGAHAEVYAMLRSELAAARRDAERYRWLRNCADRDGSGEPYIALDDWLCDPDDDDEPSDGILTKWLKGIEADAAIDAISEPTPEKGGE